MAVEKSTPEQLLNVSAVKALKSVDISEKGLSERTGKQIDEGFMNSPTSDKFITTREKPRGIAQYPILLLHSVGSEVMKNIIKDKLSSYDKGDEQILVLYKRGTNAVTLCKTTTMAEVGELLQDFCLEYTYYVSKGVTEKVNFAKHYDFSELREDIIQPYESMPSISQSRDKQDDDPQLEKIRAKALSYINEIIEVGTNEHSDLRENYLAELGLKPVDEKEVVKSISPLKDLSEQLNVQINPVTPQPQQEPKQHEPQKPQVQQPEIPKPQPPKPALLSQMAKPDFKTPQPIQEFKHNEPNQPTPTAQPTPTEHKGTIKAFGEN